MLWIINFYIKVFFIIKIYFASLEVISKMPLIKILHITNHPGTIQNINQVATYINTSDITPSPPNIPINLEITTHPWKYGYYVSKSNADEIFQSFRNEGILTQYDILLFTDTCMYARPFLQNLESHHCGIIIYITNRFDWGMQEIRDTGERAEYYNLFSHASSSRNAIDSGNRIHFIADNEYDIFYAKTKAQIDFAFPKCIRQSPYINMNINNNITNASSHPAEPIHTKFFIQNRGTPVSSYTGILDLLGIKYDVFDTVNRYRDRAHIAEYIGVLHLPYQVNIQSLMENLGYGIIHYVPSKSFFKKLLTDCDWYYWEERTQPPHLLEQSIELAEWYAPELASCFIYFDSWEDLATKYHSTTASICTSSSSLHSLCKRSQILEWVRTSNAENISKWITLFQRFLASRPTVVTMFYNVRKMDNDISDWHRAEATYYQLAGEFILKLPIPLVISMEPKNTALANLVMETRNGLGLGHITHINYERFEDTFFHQYIPRLEQLRGQYVIYNGNPRHETPRYITLNNNKFHFLETAISENKFGSDKYIWMDMGINHVAQKPMHILQWMYKIPPLVRQMCINPYLEPDKPRDLFINIFHHTAGGLITGSREYLLKYVELYKAKWAAILEEGWYQIDEAVMSMVQRDARALFTFYYGDYEGIIANYHAPDLSMNLIMEAAEKTVRYNRLDETFAIMVYLRPYFQMEWNQFSGHFYQFIQYNIICNWFGNKEALLDDVIGLINKKINSGDWYIRQVLENNKGVLQRYRNFNLINFIK